MKLETAIKIEIIILMFLAVFLVVLWTTAFGNDTLDITLHDTYFVMTNTKEKIFVFPLLLLITIIYLIKEAFYGYERKFQNLVLLTGIFLINVILLRAVGLFHTITAKLDSYTRGWTIYPPLSALPKTPPANALPHSSLFQDAWQILLFIQIFFLIILVIIAVLTGKNWNVNKRVQELP